MHRRAIGCLVCIALVASSSLTAAPIAAQKNPCAGPPGSGQADNLCPPGDSATGTVVKTYNRWLYRYAQLGAKRQSVLLNAATRIAERRRALLRRLIETAPEQAYPLSLTPGQRNGLPASIVELLETRVHTTGDLVEAYTESLPRQQPPTPTDGIAVNGYVEPDEYLERTWAVRIGDKTTNAFVYGFRTGQQTEFDTPIHAIVIDDAMAVSDSPLYLYDAFEKQQLGFKPEQIVATSGGLPIVLPGIDAFVDLEQELIGRILQFGPIFLPFHPNAWSTGKKNVLIFKVTYRGDDRESPYDDAAIATWFSGVQEFFRDNSQGRTTLTPVIVSDPIEVLEASTYAGASSPAIGHQILTDQAIATARAFGLNPDAYDRVIIFAPQLIDRPMARAPIGGRTVIVTGEKADLRVTLSHELGHTYGFPHSTFLLPSGPDPLGPGTSLEYGDIWDMMGNNGDDPFLIANPEKRHFNAFYKALAGWFLDPAVADGTAGGDFRLYAHDSIDAAGVRAIFVEAPDGSTYWIGKRDQFPANTSMVNGIEIRRVTNWPAGPFGPVELLDLDDGWTPGSTGGRTEFHSLAERNTFVDAANGITIRTVAVAVDADGNRFARVFITRP